MEEHSAASSSALRDDVLAARVDHLYRQLPRLLAYSFVVATALVVMLHGAVPLAHALNWWYVVAIFILVRLALYLRYRQRDRQAPIRRWAHLYVLLSGISGLVWGSAGIVLFTPNQVEMQAVLLLVLAGMGAGSASVLPMYLPAFYAYLPASMVPVGVMMFLQDDRFNLFMGIFVFIFLFGVLAFGRAIGAAFKNSMKLRFHNVELVARLEHQKAELEVANLAKSKFLAAASHDLRQPMHALSLFSDLLQKEAQDENARRLARNIDSSVAVLDRLFSALLDISRIDAGLIRPVTEVFAVRNVIDRVYNDTLPSARKRGLQLFVECGGEFTESDPILLERILRNLVTNAVRYTETGNVTIRCRPVASALKLSVIDTGIGIPEHQQDYVFEEFTQLDNPERDRSKGLGLGLSIVQRLARLMRHPLKIKSSEGKGSEFTVTLPLCTPPPGFAKRRRPAPAPAMSELKLEVLVVDDDPDILEGTRQLLESWGCTVHTASSAKQAEHEAHRLDRLDALITDLRLPDQALGTQVIETIRDIFGSRLPALLITGDLQPERLQQARALGLELLHKPVKPGRLRAWLQKAEQSHLQESSD